MIILDALLQAASPQTVSSEHPERDALRFCTNVVTRSRETVHPRTLGFKPQTGGSPRLDLPDGHWIELIMARDAAMGSATCSLVFDGNQDDTETELAVGLAIDKLGLKRTNEEYKERRAGSGITARKVDDEATLTYEGMANDHRLVIVHHRLSRVSGDEDSSRDMVTVIGFSSGTASQSAPAQPSRRRGN